MLYSHHSTQKIQEKATRIIQTRFLGSSTQPNFFQCGFYMPLVTTNYFSRIARVLVHSSHHSTQNMRQKATHAHTNYIPWKLLSTRGGCCNHTYGWQIRNYCRSSLIDNVLFVVAYKICIIYVFPMSMIMSDTQKLDSSPDTPVESKSNHRVS